MCSLCIEIKLEFWHMHVFLKTAYVLGDTSTHPQVYFIVIIIFFLISHGVDVIKSLFRCKFYHFKCIWRLLEVSPQTPQTVFKKIWICRNTCMLFCQFGLLTTFTKINKRGDLNKVRGDRKWEVNGRRGWVGGRGRAKVLDLHLFILFF